MDNSKSILDALEHLDPALCDYQQWIDVGMALKAENLPCSTWESWSRNDSRYHPGECERKWDTFNSSGTAGGTIVHLAKVLCGYEPKKNQILDWDDGLDAYYEEVISTGAKSEEEPWEMAARYLSALFNNDEKVSYVHFSTLKEDQGKYVPADSGVVRKVKDIIRDLKKYKDLDKAFGTINKEAGAWIRINPTTGASDKNVTDFRYALVESDDLPIEEQKKLLVNLKLPIAALVDSGGKSVHAIVKISASDYSEYKQRVSFLYDWLSKHQFIVDEANKNPARLSRLPGAVRGDRIQNLIATDIGCESWLDWKDHIEGVDDDLPPILNFWNQIQDPPQLSPELIGGILREGNKMIITGESKAGKTCLSQNLAVCIAEGKPWLGMFQCEQGKVLYMNLEVEEASLFHRFTQLYKEMGLEFTEESCSNIRPWNLRGHAIPLDKLAAKVIRRCRDTGPYKAIILDPLYKVQQGDENSAEAITTFTNALDKIAHETGAAIIYDHHHPKGSAGSRKITDRGSGSGVFSRDADAICDLSFLSPSKAVLELLGQQIADGEKPMQLAFVLRDFKEPEPINIWFKFPIHFKDTTGLLDGVPVEGSAEANFQNSSKRTSEDFRADTLKVGFEACEENGTAKLSEMVEFFGGSPSEKTLRRYVKESDEYEIDKGIVRRTKRGTKGQNE